MQIQINTDRNINGHEALASRVSSAIEAALSRFKEHISRIEVHLRDENSTKKDGTDDMRCLLEARLAGKDPLAVTHNAATTLEAVDGALEKLIRLLDTNLGRQRDKRRHQKFPAAEGAESPKTDA